MYIDLSAVPGISTSSSPSFPLCVHSRALVSTSSSRLHFRLSPLVFARQLIATNTPSSASKEVAYYKYRELSLLSAYVGENKGR
jgi:hypothetical protein